MIFFTLKNWISSLFITLIFSDPHLIQIVLVCARRSFLRSRSRAFQVNTLYFHHSKFLVPKIVRCLGLYKLKQPTTIVYGYGFILDFIAINNLYVIDGSDLSEAHWRFCHASNFYPLVCLIFSSNFHPFDPFNFKR